MTHSRLPLRLSLWRVIFQGKTGNIGVTKYASACKVAGRAHVPRRVLRHQILMDGNLGDKAPSPMEMVLMAAGGCSAIDVVSILQRAAVRMSPTSRSEADIRAPGRRAAPVYAHINLHFIVTGSDPYSCCRVARAVDPPRKNIARWRNRKAVNITHSYEVIAA